MRYAGRGNRNFEWIPPDPPNPRNGQVWYDTATGEVKMRANGETVVLGERQF